MDYVPSYFEDIEVQLSNKLMYDSSPFVEWPWFNPGDTIPPLTMDEITNNLKNAPTEYPSFSEYDDAWDIDRKRKFELDKILWLVKNFDINKTNLIIPRLYNRELVCLIDGNHTLAACVYLNLNVPMKISFAYGVLLDQFINNEQIIECNIEDADLKHTIGEDMISFDNGHSYQISQDSSLQRFWMNEIDNGAVGNLSLGDSSINPRTAIYFYGQPLVEDIPEDGPGRLHRFLSLAEMITGDPFLETYDAFLKRYPSINQH